VTVREGWIGEFRISAPLNLRRGLPSEQPYRAQPAIDLLEAGTVVRSAGPPRAYPRNGVNQYWLEVSIPGRTCSRVFIQYTGRGDRAASLRSGLAARNYEVPAAEQLVTAQGMSEVRYVCATPAPPAGSADPCANDAARAARLAEDVGAVLQTTPIRVRRFIGTPQGIPGANLEVWVDLR